MLGVSLPSCDKSKTTEGEKATETTATGDSTTKTGGITKLVVLNDNHDFGKIKVGDIKTFTYLLKNEGSEPFVFESSPKPNCDCVSTDYHPKGPIPAGATDSVVVKYTAKPTKLGTQKKVVRIIGNTEPQATLLHLSAEVSK